MAAPPRTYSPLYHDVMSRMDLTLLAKLVHSAIANCRNADGVAWPGVRKIALLCGVSDSKAVVRAIKELELAGLLAVERPPAGNPCGKTSRYRIPDARPIPESATMSRRRLQANVGSEPTLAPSTHRRRLGAYTSTPEIYTNSSSLRSEEAVGENEFALTGEEPAKTPSAKTAEAKARRPRQKRTAAHLEATIPDSLASDAFRTAWAAWGRHRAEKKNPLTPTSIKQQLKKLEAMGHDQAIAAIEHSIAGGYAGIFAPRPAPAVRGAGDWRSRNGYVENIQVREYKPS